MARPEQMERDELIHEVKRLRGKARAHKSNLRSMNRRIEELYNEIEILSREPVQLYSLDVPERKRAVL